MYVFIKVLEYSSSFPRYRYTNTSVFQMLTKYTSTSTNTFEKVLSSTSTQGYILVDPTPMFTYVKTNTISCDTQCTYYIVVYMVMRLTGGKC